MNPPESANLSIQKPKVFISHSHKDQVYAHKILAWLEKVGFSPWASFEECSDKYRMEIDTALLECDVFLLIASKDSFESIEVRRKITTAGSENKKISYYKLDESSHKRPGFFTLLSEKQYVQASKDNLELDKLALNIYETWDGNGDERVKQFRDSLISKYLANENENYLEWRERLWSSRLDSSNNPRKLSSFDIGILQREADRLGIIVSIDDENQAFSLNKLSFTNELRSLVAKQKIDKKMLIQIEKKRIESCVSKGLAVSILSDRLSKIDYLNHLTILKSAGNADHWLVSEIKSMQGKRLAISSKDATRYMDKSLSFSFQQCIIPLEQYSNGASAIKMHAISIVCTENNLAFQGLVGQTLFSFTTSVTVKKIEIDSGILRLKQEGFETHIILRIDSASSDFNNLLLFLEDVTGSPIEVLSSKDLSSSNAVNGKMKGDLPSMDKNSNVNTENRSDDAIKIADCQNNSSSTGPDSFFYGLIATMVLLVIIISAMR